MTLLFCEFRFRSYVVIFTNKQTSIHRKSSYHKDILSNIYLVESMYNIVIVYCV